MARAATTSDVFNAIAEARRREILDALMERERTVGELVALVGVSQPQVSRHLRVLGDVGLVAFRAEGRRHLYHLNHERLRPLGDWLARHERAGRARLDRMDAYLTDLQRGATR